MKIKAAVVRQKNGPFGLENVVLNEPAEDQILVRVVVVISITRFRFRWCLGMRELAWLRRLDLLSKKYSRAIMLF